MASITTYEQFQARPSSEKIGLAIFEAAKRLVTWTLDSGSVYYAELSDQVVEAVTQDGTSLTAAASVGAITAGKYYFDRTNARLYVRTSDSTDPATKFITVKVRLFFSNFPVNAPHDLSTGYEVPWEPLLDANSSFLFEVENSKSLLGVAIANASGVNLKNDRELWDPIYDTYAFDNHLVLLYSWNRLLPITEAKLLYKGKVARKSYSMSKISFELRDFLDELRAPVAVANLVDYVGAIIPQNLEAAKQRKLYGYVFGHVPTPIDQVLPTTGWALTGTLSVNASSTSVSGASTEFLKEVSPGDDLIIGTSTRKVRVKSVTSDGALVLASGFPDSNQAAVTAYIFPSHPKRYANRRFLVAGHALARPSTTITSIVDNATFGVASTEFLAVGDVIEVAGNGATIRELGDGLVKLVQAIEGTLSVGATVYRSSIGNVYLGGELLQLTRDYTYDADDALLELTETAEFNVAPNQGLSGTIAIVNGDRDVVGTGTLFRTELRPGSWISVASGSNWFEVLEVVDDENLIVRTVPAGNESGAAVYRTPNVYKNGSTVLTCDAIGKKDGDGNFLRYPAEIAKDLLADAGLSEFINDASFVEADELSPHRIGFAIPAKYSDKRAPNLRDILSRVCRSAFVGLALTNDFELQMKALDPSAVETTELQEADCLEADVRSDSSQIVRAANVTYLVKEYEAASEGPSSQIYVAENDQYLSSTEKEFDLDTYLVEEDDAFIMASRWAFLLSAHNSDLEIETKMQAARLAVFDVLKVSHEKLYLRFGSEERSRIGVISSIEKTVEGTKLRVNDLGNAFARCARIAADGSAGYGSASAADKLVNGYIADANGLTDTRFGINLIW